MYSHEYTYHKFVGSKRSASFKTEIVHHHTTIPLFHEHDYKFILQGLIWYINLYSSIIVKTSSYISYTYSHSSFLWSLNQLTSRLNISFLYKALKNKKNNGFDTRCIVVKVIWFVWVGNKSTLYKRISITCQNSVFYFKLLQYKCLIRKIRIQGVYSCVLVFDL